MKNAGTSRPPRACMTTVSRHKSVPEKYSFWDLHVAVQGAMGWLDYHLHEFRLLGAAEQQVVSIGIPTDDDPEDRPVVPGRQVPLSKFFDQRNWHGDHSLFFVDSTGSRSASRQDGCSCSRDFRASVPLSRTDCSITLDLSNVSLALRRLL